MKTILDLAKGNRFNGKVYGKEGSFSIYLNNKKVEISDEQEAEYSSYIKDFEDFRKNLPAVLNSAECQEIAIKNGVEKEFVEPTFEELKAKKDLFLIEEKTVKSENGVKATLQTAKYNGKIVSAYVSNSLGNKFYAHTEEQFAELLAQV